ncbi:MAG TPA: acyl-CoA dehydrogenase family protein, partial [Nitriliruptorales bacterium]
MDFELSPDQSDLQHGARDLLDGYSGPAQVRAHLAADRAYDESLWSAMAEQGWCAVAVPEDQGGLGLGWVEAGVLLAEVGRHTSPVPLLPTLLATAALTRHGAHAELVERLAAGDAIGAVAWSADSVVSGATRLGPVEGASIADVLVVVMPDGVHLVEEWQRPAQEPAMDLTRTLSWVDVDVAAAERIGDAADAAFLGALGAVGSSAELLGGAERALEMATEYAKDRVQFGQPIGSFQAIKHRCADMLVDVEGMRSVVWYGSWSVATVDDGWAMAASTAKVWCAD